MSDFKIEWNGAKVLEATRKVVDKVSKEVANDVMRDAKAILKRKAKTTTETGLLSQFSVDESKYKDGGYLVYCQGPGNWRPPYYASFVELGSWSSVYGKYKRAGAESLKGISPIYINPKPFMRPAAKKNKRKANRKFQAAMDRL